MQYFKNFLYLINCLEINRKYNTYIFSVDFDNYELAIKMSNCVPSI